VSSNFLEFEFAHLHGAVELCTVAREVKFICCGFEVCVDYVLGNFATNVWGIDMCLIFCYASV